MRNVDLRSEKMDLGELLHLAQGDSVLVVAGDGREFVVAEADDFEAEVEALRNSARFQSFLDERMTHPGRTSIEDIEKELAAEVAP